MIKRQVIKQINKKEMNKWWGHSKQGSDRRNKEIPLKKTKQKKKKQK